jgi:hypothetical protein
MAMLAEDAKTPMPLPGPASSSAARARTARPPFPPPGCSASPRLAPSMPAGIVEERGALVAETLARAREKGWGTVERR